MSHHWSSYGLRSSHDPYLDTKLLATLDGKTVQGEIRKTHVNK